MTAAGWASTAVRVPFAVAGGQAPALDLPAGHCAVGASFSSCSGGGATLHLVGKPDRGLVDADVDDGVPRDCWWKVRADGVPERFFRLLGGRAALGDLLRMYGFLDAESCLSAERGAVVCEPLADARRAFASPCAAALPVDARVVGPLTGVPQRVRNSGICWFASVCFALFYHRRMREHVCAHLDADLRADAERCLADPQAAERLRGELWRRYAFGDPIGQDPRLDGQNGTSQIFILASQIGLPMRRFMMHGDEQYEIDAMPVKDMRGGTHRMLSRPAREGDAHVVVVRFRRGQHTTRAAHRPRPFLFVDGRRYRLVAMMIGSEQCGHQVCVASPGGTIRTWASCDSDARRLGVGPTIWSTPKVRAPTAEGRAEADEAWERSFLHAVPSILFAKGVCQMSPLNPQVQAAEELIRRHSKPIRVVGGGEGGGGGGCGLTNTDLIYLSAR
jgi:hypothetical protein